MKDAANPIADITRLAEAGEKLVESLEASTDLSRNFITDLRGGRLGIDVEIKIWPPGFRITFSEGRKRRR